MRIVVVVFAAFLTLGLAAFGVVAAQRANAPGSHIAMAAKVEPVSPRPVENPVSQIAQAPVAEPAQAPAIPQAPAPAAPIRVASYLSAEIVAGGFMALSIRSPIRFAARCSGSASRWA